MGEKATLAKAKQELEELYLGVPDESVNLTFQDFAQVRQLNADKKRFSPSSTTKTLSKEPQIPPSPLAKLPSIDFNKCLEASTQRTSNNNAHMSYSHHQNHQHRPDQGHHDHHHHRRHDHHEGAVDQRSTVYDDMSHASGMSVAYGVERGGRRRPGIPHSNICTICCNYVYIFRHRCLVCGRVYCRHCVSVGMGEMTEGRKCVECLGRRFSQRYIHKAAKVGCCTGYPSMVKQQELKWAEKGARRSGENRHGGNSVMASRSRSPVGLATPTRQHSPSNPPSFVTNSPCSPYSPSNHHPMPF